MKLRARRVLITAGPTWAPIDSVRFIGNIASGETGIMLARELARRGAAVTLVLGPGVCARGRLANVTIMRFTFFRELCRILETEVSSGRYDCVVHAAAVCDYLPGRIWHGKIVSAKTRYLKLVPAPKLIDSIRKWDPAVLLIGFKFEPDADRSTLLREAQGLMRRSGAKAVLANTLKAGSYRAYLVEQSGAINKPLIGKPATARALAAFIASYA
jgi:phosphopantothenoylcysteine synthetase/decarboxylase